MTSHCRQYDLWVHFLRLPQNYNPTYVFWRYLRVCHIFISSPGVTLTSMCNEYINNKSVLNTGNFYNVAVFFSLFLQYEYDFNTNVLEYDHYLLATCILEFVLFANRYVIYTNTHDSDVVYPLSSTRCVCVIQTWKTPWFDMSYISLKVVRMYFDSPTSRWAFGSALRLRLLISV